MKNVVFLYSGEGTRSGASSSRLLETSPCWAEIDAILQSHLHLSLDRLWHGEKTCTAARTVRC